MNKTLLIEKILSLLKDKPFTLIKNNHLLFNINNNKSSIYSIHYQSLKNNYLIKFFPYNISYVETPFTSHQQLLSYLNSMNILDLQFIKSYIIKNSIYHKK